MEPQHSLHVASLPKRIETSIQAAYFMLHSGHGTRFQLATELADVMEACCAHGDTLEGFRVYLTLFRQLFADTALAGAMLQDLSTVRQQRRGIVDAAAILELQRASNRSLLGLS